MAVRREAVRLDVEGNFARQMLESAAATEVLKRSLKDLSGTSVQSSRASKDLERGLKGAAKETDNLGKSAKKSEAEVDRLSGRMAIVRDLALTMGPGLVPIGGVGAAAVAGLANQFAFAAAGAGSLLIAMHGVTDAVKAVEKARLQPTATNLQAAQLAMEKLAPQAREFVTEFDRLMPVLNALQGTAAAGWFPGLTHSLGDFRRLAPELNKILSTVSTTGGNLFGNAADSLASAKWRPFFDFIAREAPAAMTALGHVVGSLTHGLAELWMSFSPLNHSFNNWLMSTATSFDTWATGLAKTQGFQDFLDYVHTNGPRVAHAVESVANAVVQVVQAIAPLGGPSLKIISAFADIVAQIANSDLGTPILAGVAALAAYNRALSLTAALQKRVTGSTAIADSMGTGGIFGATKAGGLAARTRLTQLRQDIGVIGTTWATAGARSEREAARLAAAQERVGATLKPIGKGALVMGGLALATSGAADSMHLTNTASLAMMGTIGGPWGAAIGAGVGLALDFAHANDDVKEALKGVDEIIASGNLDALQQKYADLAAAGQKAAGSDLLTNGPGTLLAAQFNPLGHLEDIKQTYSDVWASITGHQTDAEKAASDMAKVKDAITQAEEEQRQFGRDQALHARLVQDRTAAVATAAAFVDFSDKIAGAKFRLSDYLKALHDQAIALRNFRINAETAGARGLKLGLVEHLRELGPAGAQALAALAHASRSEIAKANADFASLIRQQHLYAQSATNDIGAAAKAYEALPTAVQTRIQTVGIPTTMTQVEALVRQYELTAEQRTALISLVDHASPGIRGIQNLMAALKDKNITITTTWRNIYTAHQPGPGLNGNGSHGYNIDPNTGQAVPNGSADGTTVPKTGRPYADRHLYLLADGEEVISNRYGQADRHRALLKAINANRMASGGTVGRSYSSGEIDYDRLGKAVAKHMPRASFPSKLTLEAGGKTFDAHVRGIARDEVDQDREFWKGR